MLSILLMSEAFSRLPDDLNRTNDSLNSWFANTTEPTCCWLGDEKMAWIWRYLQQDLCMAKGFPHPEGRPACLFPKNHQESHQLGHYYRDPFYKSLFDYMEEFPMPEVSDG